MPISEPIKAGELFSYFCELGDTPRKCILNNKITEGEIAKKFDIKLPGGKVMDISKEDMDKINKFKKGVGELIPFG
jgi:hypothetical protein